MDLCGSLWIIQYGDLVGGFKHVFIFHFIYGMSSQPHWRTPSFFKMGTVDDQPASHDHPWIPGIKSPTANLGERSCKDGKEISHLKERIPTAYGQNQLWLLQNYDMYIYIYTIYSVYRAMYIYICTTHINDHKCTFCMEHIICIYILHT